MYFVWDARRNLTRHSDMGDNSLDDHEKWCALSDVFSVKGPNDSYQ